MVTYLINQPGLLMTKSGQCKTIACMLVHTDYLHTFIGSSVEACTKTLDFGQYTQSRRWSLGECAPRHASLGNTWKCIETRGSSAFHPHLASGPDSLGAHMSNTVAVFAI